MFNFAFDSDSGTLTVVVIGSWTMAEVERYGREAGLEFTQARKKAGNLRLLIDLEGTQVLSQTVIEPLAKAGMQYSQPDDRVAVLVNSTLMKIQMKRMVGDAPVPVFLVRDQAVAWLASSGDAASAVA